MSQFVLPAVFALFLWWFSTGVVFYLDGLPRRTFRWSMLGATVVLIAALYGLWVSAHDTTVGGAYRSFTAGLLAWVWIEASYYLGYLTGPRTRSCVEGCGGWRHFGHAVQSSLWHELAIVAVVVVMATLVWGAPNQLGLWIFVVLLAMHESARLNVFLGVRNVNADLLPDHLSYLRCFLRRRPMNPLFPVSVTVSTVVAAWLIAQAVGAETAHQTVGYSALSALVVVGVLEHWFLVLPFDVAALWRWSLGSRGRAAAAADRPASFFVNHS